MISNNIKVTFYHHHHHHHHHNHHHHHHYHQYKGVDLHQLIPHASNDCVDLLIKLLKYDAADRITAREATKHSYFKDVREAEQRSNLSKTDGSDVASINSNSIIQGGNNANGLVSKSEKNNQMPPMKSQQQYQQYQQLQNSINKPMNITFPQPANNTSSNIIVDVKKPYGVNNTIAGGSSLPPIGQQQQQQQQQQQKYMMQQQQQIQQQAALQQQAQQRIMQITNQQKRKKKYRLNNYGNKIGQQQQHPNMMSQIKPNMMQIGGDPYILKK